MSQRAKGLGLTKKGAPRKRAPGAGRPVRLEPPEGQARLVVRLDAASKAALLWHRNEAARLKRGGEASASVRELLTAWGDSAKVRAAVAAWRSEQGDEGKMWFGRPVKSAKKERGA